MIDEMFPTATRCTPGEGPDEVPIKGPIHAPAQGSAVIDLDQRPPVGAPRSEFLERQLELLRPHEIREALEKRSLMYIPLGTIEWHAEHLPVGLDGLTAHGVCLEAAVRFGGLVYPPLYFGTGGGHGNYPWTVMMAKPDELQVLLSLLLARLESFGVAVAVLFSGHFADEQLAMIQSITEAWNTHGEHSLRVVAAGINMAEGTTLAPDHAGVFETTMLSALWPDRVEIARLPALDATALCTDDVAPERNDPTHPLWGIFGPDPRSFEPANGEALLHATANWLAALAFPNGL
jgi:creatinine amidohydrolase